VAKIIVLGSSGMAGSMIHYTLENYGHTVINYARNKIRPDTRILDIDTIHNEILDEEPFLVVNCIGRLVQQSEDNIEEAFRINSLLPIKLGETVRRCGSALIHLSTDCVFSGYTETYYNEDCYVDPNNIYGVTKYVGEQCSRNGLVIRTSIIGPEIVYRKYPGLFEWLLKNKEVDGWKNASWSGVTTLELAKYIHYLIINKKLPVTGLRHLCNNDYISKYDLLHLINNTYNLGIKINPVEGAYCNRFIKTKEDFGYQVPSYKKMIEEMYNV
jgi:dTDP-4-dehydrorhamnose reductase